MAVCMERPKDVSAPSSLADMHAEIKLALLMCKSLVCSCPQHHLSDLIQNNLISSSDFGNIRCSMAKKRYACKLIVEQLGVSAACLQDGHSAKRYGRAYCIAISVNS